MGSLPLSEAIVRYEVPWLDMDWPICWEDVFERNGPLVVEIGFGNGGFLLDMAGNRPSTNFLGIERAWGSVQRLFRRLDRSGMENVRVVSDEAAYVVSHLFGPDSISEMFINFPDPWHKKAHHPRRLIQPGFVQTLAARLEAGGRLTIATDQAEYAAWISEVLEGQSALRSCFTTPSVDVLENRKPTKYEKKAIAGGVPIHYFVWELARGTDASVEAERAGTMPNVILEGAIDRTRLLADFTPRSWQTEREGVRVVVKLGEVYGQLQAGHRLVETLVKEGELIQSFGISVILRPNGQVLVKLSSMGHPRPTWGVKEAVWRTAQLVMSQCPHLRVKTSTVVPEWQEG